MLKHNNKDINLYFKVFTIPRPWRLCGQKSELVFDNFHKRTINSWCAGRKCDDSRNENLGILLVCDLKYITLPIANINQHLRKDLLARGCQHV